MDWVLKTVLRQLHKYQTSQIFISIYKFYARCNLERHLSDADFQLVFEVRIQNYLWAIELLALPLLNVRRCVQYVFTMCEKCYSLTCGIVIS